MRLAHNFSYMVLLSFLLHITVIGIASITFRKKPIIYVPTSYKVKIVAPEVGNKRAVAKGKAEKKPLKKKAAPHKRVSKDDVRMIEERIELLKAKKKIEEIVKLRSHIDVSIQKTAEELEEEVEREEGLAEQDWSEVSDVRGGITGLMEAYYNRIAREIRGEWVYPEFARGDFEALLSITIEKNGKVKSIALEKSSGNELFDRSVIRAITKASPLSRPPFEMEIGLRFRP